jgi:hypothetical protein
LLRFQSSQTHSRANDKGWIVDVDVEVGVGVGVGASRSKVMMDSAVELIKLFKKIKIKSLNTHLEP